MWLSERWATRLSQFASQFQSGDHRSLRANVRDEGRERFADLMRAILGNVVFRGDRNFTLIGPFSTELSGCTCRPVPLISIHEQLRDAGASRKPIAVSLDEKIIVLRFSLEHDLAWPD